MQPPPGLTRTRVRPIWWALVGVWVTDATPANASAPDLRAGGLRGCPSPPSASAKLRGPLPANATVHATHRGGQAARARCRSHVGASGGSHGGVGGFRSEQRGGGRESVGTA